MNRVLVNVAVALAATAAFAPPVRAETFNSQMHARAFEAAERGADSLRAFVSRTRMIYGLNFADYSRAIPASAVELVSDGGEAGAGAPPELDELAAPAPASPEQRAADELREQILRDLSHE